MTTSDQPIAIRVWRQLEALLTKETSEYLAKDKFVLQRDAYTRLADEDVESDAPWLTYDLSEATSDESLDFSLYFFSGGFVLNIGPASFEIPYGAFGFSASEIEQLNHDQILAADPQVVAQNILLTIKLLLNGQIAVGCHWYRHRLIAAETFLLGYEPKPFPITISGQFSLTKRAAHEYTLRQNRLLAGQIKVTDDFPLLPPIINGECVRRGRDVDTIHDLEPFTKKQFDELKTHLELHEFAGKGADENIWGFFYRTIPFWVVAITTVSVMFWIRSSPLVPDMLQSEWMYYAQLLTGWLIVQFGTGAWLGWRQMAINAGRQPLTYRLEQKIAPFGAVRLIIVALNVALIPIILLAPIWTPKGDNVHLYSAVTLAGQFPALLVLPAISLVSIVLALYRRFYTTRLGRIFIAALAAAYLVLVFALNDLYMNTSEAAPSPSDWALIAVMLLPLMLTICGIVEASRKSK